MKPADERDLAFDRLIARGLEREADVMGTACPDADLLAAWFDRSLSTTEAERIETHAAACASCQQILADLARTEPVVVRAAPEPAPARPWLWHWRWLVPAATAVVLMVLAANTLRAPGLLRPIPVDRSAPVAQEAAAVSQARAEDAPSAQPAAPTAIQGKGQAGTAPARTSAPPAGLLADNLKAPAPISAPPSGFLTDNLQVAPPRKETAAVRPGLVAEEKARPMQQRAEAGSAAGATVAGLPKTGTADKALNRLGESVTVVSPAAPAAAPTAAPSAAGGVAFNALTMKAQPLVVPLIPAVAPSPSRNAAWRVGMNGSIERSLDGLVTWQPQASGTRMNLAAASAPADTVCWAVGSGGVVLRTTDGTTWQTLPAPTTSDLVFVRASSQDAATVRAADGVEYTTSDAGRTWAGRQR